MQRIECENDDCDQVLTVEDQQCDECGRRQSTRRWTLIVLGLYYPLLTLLISFILFLFLGMLFPAGLGRVGPVSIVVIVLAVYVALVVSTVRDYVERRRRIQESDATTAAFFDDRPP